MSEHSDACTRDSESMKPRIKRVRWLWIFRRWKCYGNRAVGYGKTPMDAYIHWMMCEAISGI